MKNKKLIIACAAVVLCLIAAVIAAVFTTGEKKIPAAADSRLVCDYSYVYYNDINGRVCRADSTGGKVRVIKNDAEVVSAHGENVLLRIDNSLVICDRNGNEEKRFDAFSPDLAALAKNSIYYIEGGNNLIAIDRATGDSEQIASFEGGTVTAFCVDGFDVIYALDNTSLHKYNVRDNTNETMITYMEITSFTCDDGYLVIPNPNNEYTALKIALFNYEPEEYLQIHSKNLAYKNGILYYLENVGTDKKEYTVKTSPIGVH